MAQHRIYSSTDVTGVHLLRAALDGQDILSRVTEDGFAGEMPTAALWVEASDAARAQEIIADFQKAPAPSHPADLTEWACPNCRELVDAHFEICWNCQSSRDCKVSDTPSDPAGPMIGHDLQCIQCAYNLRGLTPAGRCPECGTAILHTILNRLHGALIPDDQQVQSILYAAVRPVSLAIGTAPSVLCLICHAWLRASEPLGDHDPHAHTPADVAWLTCDILGQLALDHFGSPNAAISGLRAAGIASPPAIALNLTSLMNAGLLEKPAYDLTVAFANLPALATLMTRA